MIPDNHLTVEGQELRDDTKEFLNDVLISLLRTLLGEGLSSKDCNFLGTNDIVIFRASEAMLVIFSRAIKDYAVRIVEVTGDGPTEADDDLGQTHDEDDLETPQYFESREAIDRVKQGYGLVDPVAIIFPLNYLTLEGEEKEDAAKAVAKLLVEPTKVDVDRKNRIVRVNPIFQSRDHLLDPDLVFVLMEFKEPFLGIYEGLIKPVVEEEGFRPMKSDDIFSTTAVVEDIWENINRAALVIAEISTNNPNVMYELGICHTVGKNVMMITQDTSSIPFNFRHLRCYGYKDDIRGANELKDNLRSVLRQIRVTSDPMTS
jgi:hypothetical protein